MYNCSGYFLQYEDTRTMQFANYLHFTCNIGNYNFIIYIHKSFSNT